MTMNVVSGIPQAVNGHRHTISSMTEEWRVSLVVEDHGAPQGDPVIAIF